MIWSDWIKDARQRLGMTQEQFAGVAGVSLSTIRNYERGRVREPFLMVREAIVERVLRRAEAQYLKIETFN